MILFVMLAVLAVGGCAEMDVPTPEKLLDRPLGTDAVKVGMSKDQVRSLWGEPDNISTETDADKRVREVWTYSAKYSALPVDSGYMSKPRYLYFDNESLTKIQD